MLGQIRPAIVMIVLFTLLTGLAYPLAITGVAQLAFHDKANGSQIERGGVIVGSSLIGQNFTSDKYFRARPSATSAPDPVDSSKTVDAPYNAANSRAPISVRPRKSWSTGFNASDRGGVRRRAHRRGSRRRRDDIGLGPRSTYLTAIRAGAGSAVARARNLNEGRVREIVEDHIEPRALGLSANPG